MKESRWDGMSGLIKSRAAMLKDNLGKSHIFARGADDGLWDNVDGVWQELGGVIASDPCAVKDHLGVAHVFAIGSNGALFDWISGTGWTNLGGHVTSNPSAALSPDGHIKIAAKSSDNGLLIKDLTSGEWSNLGGKITSNPQLIFDLQGKMHVLAQGSDGALWDNVDGTWQTRGGIITSDARSIINPFNPGLIYTSVRGSDGALWVNSLDTSSGTSTWVGLGGMIVGAPSPSVDTDGVLHTFIRSREGELWENADGSWHSLGGFIISDPSTFRDRDGKLLVAVTGGDNGLWVNTVGASMTPTTLVGSFSCDDTKIQPAIDAMSSGGIVKVLSGSYPENVVINKELTLTGTGNPIVTSFTLNAILGTDSRGITAPQVTVNAGFRISQAIDLASAGGSVKVNGAAGYTYSDDLTQGFYEKGITLTGSNGPVTKSITLDQDVAGKISGIAASTIIVQNPKAKIQDGIILVQSGGTISAKTGNYLEDIDINKDFVLIGIGNPVVSSISIHVALGKYPSGISASKVTIDPPSRILDGILISSKDVYVNGALGYVYGDDLTQSFYEKGIIITGINNPVISSLTLDRDVAGRISGISANTVNVNANARILQAIDLANAGALVKVNGASGYTYNDDLTQSFYEKGILLTGINNPIINSITLDQDIAGKINGIKASTAKVNPGGRVLQAIDMANSGGSVIVNGADGFIYSDDLTQSFYEKGIILKAANNPVTKSISLDQGLAGKISGIIANTINILTPNAKIQDGVVLVSPAGTVNVASGTYKENIVIDRSLTLKGMGAFSCTVDGNKAGSVFTIGKDDADVDVTLSGMTLTGGTGTPGTSGTSGGGILNNGNLMVKDCAISGNTAGCGGGIQNSGIATIVNTTISGNIAKTDGGGISSSGTITMNNNDISGNTANECGGGIGNSGTLNLEGCRITGNVAVLGSGISNRGTFTMKSGSITENRATDGGGIRNSGTMTLKGGSIFGNDANVSGGGIGNSGTLNLGGGSITGNTAIYGGGISSSGTITMNSGSIAENTATDGGGIFSDNHGTVNMDGGSIDRNIANVSGGGIYSLGGTVNIDGGSINKNFANVSGGGIYGNSYVTINLFGGEIIENSVVYYGGGICSQGTAHLHGGNITGNMASDGGGIYSSGAITMNGGSIDRNAANNGSGGGCFNAGSLDLGGGIIAENAANYGGGVYSSSNSHIMFDGVQVFIKSNKAHLPSPSELSWYQGWGVFLEEGMPAVKGNFSQTMQVTGNIRI